MKWIKAIPQNELPDGTKKVVSLEDKSILFINHQGNIYALASACPHMHLPLKNGKITEDGHIICPWHHSKFDLKTGEVKEWSPWPPGAGKLMGMLSKEKNLPVYQTRIEEENIFIDIED